MAADRTVTERPAPPVGTYQIDGPHSVIQGTVRHLMISKVRGTFGEVSGEIVVAEDPTDSRVEVTIQAASIHTRDEQRDGHLRSDDFLDVAHHPTIQFVSTSVEPAGDAWKLTGDLTMRGVTRPVTLDFAYTGSGANPLAGGTNIGFEARGRINRDDFGVNWNQTLEAGGVMVSKEVDVSIELEANLPD